jgi:dTDP-4-amino-4,6-dideoxygalactose transaminase
MPWAKHVYHLYVIRTPDRDELRAALEAKGISAAMHYPIPIHKQEAWRHYGGEEYSLPVTEQTTREILSLPMYPDLTDDEVDYVCQCVREHTESRLTAAAKR